MVLLLLLLVFLPSLLFFDVIAAVGDDIEDVNIGVKKLLFRY